MSFYGCHFSFDGTPCTEYGLMLYDFGTSGSENGTLASGIEIVEDRIARRSTPLHYGTVMNKPLEFNMTFGADLDAIDRGVYLDRWDLDAITNWLIGHNTYKWLEITQPDMETVRYRCIITNLQYTSVGKYPWALNCTVQCDSPFAYLFPETHTYVINGHSEFKFLNKSTCRRYYKPKLIIRPAGGGMFSIVNASDDANRAVTLTLPSGKNNLEIEMDNENEIIREKSNAIANLYPYFNFNFFRLKNGNNNLIVNGTGTLEIQCEFPISIGG